MKRKKFFRVLELLLENDAFRLLREIDYGEEEVMKRRLRLSVYVTIEKRSTFIHVNETMFSELEGYFKKKKLRFYQRCFDTPDSNFQFSVYQLHFVVLFIEESANIVIAQYYAIFEYNISKHNSRFLIDEPCLFPHVRHNWICEQSAEYIHRAYEFQQRRVTVYFGCVHVFHNFPQLVTANGILLQQAR